MLRGGGGGAGGVSSYVPSGGAGTAPFRITVPLIWPSNGTAMSATGVFTLAAALPYNPGVGFMYLPTNAMFGGSSAGFWYVQLTSTTTGTAFTNFYGGTGGLPSLPASPSGLAGGTGAPWSTPTANISFAACTPTLNYGTGSVSYLELYAAFSCVGATARTFTWFANTITTPIAVSAAAITNGVTACGGFVAVRPCPSGFQTAHSGLLMPVGTAAQYGTGTAANVDTGTLFSGTNSLGVGSTTAIAGATDSCICDMVYMQIYP